MKRFSQYAFITLLFVLTMVISCSKDNEVKPVNTDPISGNYSGRDSLYSFSISYNANTNTVSREISNKVRLITKQVTFKQDSMLVYYDGRKFILNEQYIGGAGVYSAGGHEVQLIQFRNDSLIYTHEVSASTFKEIKYYYTFTGKKLK